MPTARKSRGTATTWTATRIKALGARTNVPTTCSIFGMSERTGRDLIKRGEFPVPVLRLGTKKQVVPVAPILALLGIDADDQGAAEQVA
jgi:hypothetical protein